MMTSKQVSKVSVFAALAFASVASVAVPSVTAAQPRVTVREFSGPGASSVRDRVVAALVKSGDVVIVPSSDIARASEDVGSDTKALSAKLQINAFVEGRVTKRGRRWSAKISVIEGASGDSVGSTTLNGRNAAGLGNAAKGIWGKLGSAIGGAQAAEEGGGADEEPARVQETEDEPLAASGEGKTLAVLNFSGAGSDSVRSSLAGALEREGHTLVDGDTAEAAARDEGADLDTADGRVTVARELKVAAIIAGKVQRQGRRKFKAVITVYNGADGESLGQASFVGRTAGAAAQSVKQRANVELGSAIASAEEPSAAPSRRPVAQADDEEPSSGDDEAEEDDEDDADDGEGSAVSALTVGLRFVGFWRDFGYNDDLNGNLLTYKLGPAPMAGLDVTWYPAAHFTRGFASNIGIDGRFAMALGVKSEDPQGGVTYDTSSTEWGAGLRVRLPFDRDEAFANVGLGGRSFSIAAKGGSRPDIPDVSYLYARLGVGGLFWLGPLSLRGRGAFLLGLGAGSGNDAIGSDDWFPALSQNGLEGAVEVGYEIFTGFEARVGFELQYFFYSLNPEPSDARAQLDQVAGGASDLYPAITVTASYTLPGI